MEWNEISIFLEKLASRHTLIRYDKHGCGLSDRDRGNFTFEKEFSDLEAVINHLELSRFILFGYSQSGSLAMAYAAKYPERLSHLILYGTYARGIEIATTELKSALRFLIRASWGLGSKTLADRFIPGADKAGLENFARYQRESATGEMAARLSELSDQIDIKDLLSNIITPTLVIHRQEDEVIPVQLGKQLAIFIPKARLVLLEGKDHLPYFGDSDGIIRTIIEFLDAENAFSIEKLEEKYSKKKNYRRKLAVILIADVKDYSRLMNDDEDETICTLEDYRTAINALIQGHRGRLIDFTGDNLLSEFESVKDAVKCAVEIQKKLKDKNDRLPESRKMDFRIGINLGDIVDDGDRLYGDGINIASRIESLAEGGGICISGTVYDQIENKLPLGYEYLGEKSVKNIPKPVRVYQIKMDSENGSS